MTSLKQPVCLIALFLLLAAPAAQATPTMEAAPMASNTIEGNTSDTTAVEDTAVEAATAWLALVDGGEYGKSWDEAAAYFQNAVPREKWEQALTAARKPLGHLASRQVKSADYQTALPGAPDGEYVVMQFTTSFAGKAEAIETVTFMREPDGTWRAAGYFIK